MSVGVGGRVSCVTWILIVEFASGSVLCTLAVRSIAGASSTVQPSERRSLSVITPAAGADIGARNGDGR